MIKQTWNIGEEERKRILNLHETATKKLYLIKEQQEGAPKTEKSWSLCELTIYQSGDKFYTTSNEVSVEIPRLSQVSGTIQGRNLKLSQTTQNGIDIGEQMKKTKTCANEYPMAYRGNYKWFCYFDDVSKTLVGDRGQEKYVNNNVPVYGIICYDGTLGEGGGDFTGEKIPKDKDGIVIQYQVSRSKSFVFEVSPAMQGTLTVEKENPITPIPPKTETIELNVESPFVFDSTELTPEAQQQFNQFVEEVKKNYQGVTGNVDVITSASIDADPVDKKTYNMELSTRRATAIIELLKSSLGQTSLTFSPKPIGQTDQFARGMKWPEVTDKNQTAPNRRLIIKLPKITKEVK